MGESGKANPELNLIQEDAAARAKIEEIAEKIRFATENLDEEWLMFGIDQNNFGLVHGKKSFGRYWCQRLRVSIACGVPVIQCV